MTKRPAPAERRGHGTAGWVTVAVTALIMPVSILYAAGVPWVRTGLDGFWTWFDGSIDRLRLLGALIPAGVAFIAYCVYTADRVWKISDRWWKRAEWALDTATDYARRAVGMKALTELSNLPMADTDDRQLFNGRVVAVRDAGASRLASLCRKTSSRKSWPWTTPRRSVDNGTTSL